MPPIPEQVEGIGRLHAHTLGTDPGRFLVAERRAAPADRRRQTSGAARPMDDDDAIVGFASAVERGDLWFLSMLFVAPGRQARGLGRRLLAAVMPEPGRTPPAMAAASDSVQPISNGLYASYGIVPRMPLAHLVGRPTRLDALPALPSGASAGPLAPGTPLPEEVHALDRQVLGFDHAADHDYAMDTGRQIHLVHGGDGRLLGYGYATAVGYVGPVAVLDPGLLAPVTAYLLSAVSPRGALAAWVPGAAGDTFRSLVRAGLRIDGFPLLLCWSRPFADFARYVPMSPGLL